MSIAPYPRTPTDTSFILAWEGVHDDGDGAWRSIHVLLGLKWAYGDSSNMEAFADASLLYNMAIDISSRSLQDEF